MAGRRTGQTVTCQAQTIPGLILTTRYICDCVTHSKVAITCACVFSTHLMFCFPSVVHMVCVCWGGSRHHTELQELQPGDSGCVWVWLRGGARQRRYWSWESAGKVRPAFTVTVTEGKKKKKSVTFYGSYITTVFWSSLFASGFVVPPSPRTWPPPDPTWLWCLWLMREWLTAASMQHTRLCPYWTVSSCYCKPSSYYIKELLVPFFVPWTLLSLLMSSLLPSF